MRGTSYALLAGLALAVLAGCARIEHATDIGSEQQLISLYVLDQRIEAALAPDTYEVTRGENHVVICFWLRPGGRNHYQFREELKIEYNPHTGDVVRGVWRSDYYNVGQERAWEGERDTNWIEGGNVLMPRLDGGTGWMTLSLGKEWWRTTPVVDVKFRKFTNPARFPTED
ncbi:MAG: hypothetical protein HY720_26085 [Planctomycetes bacterium]|nr:hypothetical protein [Planctomycetota bacterium]